MSAYQDQGFMSSNLNKWLLNIVLVSIIFSCLWVRSIYSVVDPQRFAVASILFHLPICRPSLLSIWKGCSPSHYLPYIYFWLERITNLSLHNQLLLVLFYPPPFSFLFYVFGGVGLQCYKVRLIPALYTVHISQKHTRPPALFLNRHLPHQAQRTSLTDVPNLISLSQ